MDEPVTIFDIAKEADVSIATVSRVLSGGANVRAATREKVMRAVEKHDFKPSMVAAGLSKRTSRTLGVVLPLIDNPFYTQLCLAAQMEAQRLGYSVMLYQLERFAPHGQRFVDMLIGKRLDGVVISGDIASDTSYGSVAECIAQIRRYMPVVVINPAVMEVPCPSLLCDMAGGMRMAIRHLSRLGHRRIAMIGGDGDPHAEQRHTREFAYLDEMRRLGNEKYICPFTTGQAPIDGESCVYKLFSSINETRMPTALVAFNDLVALGVIKELRRIGIMVPGNMAVIGFDNQFFSAYVDPPLTTVDLMIEDVARQAVRLLSEDLGQERGVFQRTFEPALIVRESCGGAAESV